MIGDGFDLQDGQPVVDGDAHPHLVQRRTGRDFAAPSIAEGIALDIGHMPFDVPKTIRPLETAAFDLAGMKRLAWRRIGERHAAEASESR